MQDQTPLGILHFLTHADAIGIGLLVVMLFMSVLSWTLIVVRIRRAHVANARNKAFARRFKAGEELTATRDGRPGAGFERIAQAGLAAVRHCAAEAEVPSVAAPAVQFHLDRALQQQIDDEILELESGQTALASIASSAPFIGLFGTVWGIYHALLKIGATGQSSLDQVAGPIGEALIMTACGLAVAIPAGLAYNAFQRQLRVQIAELEQFANALQLRLLSGRAPA